MERLVGLSIGALQKKYGDLRAIEIAREIGADAVDFSIDDGDADYRNENSVYSKGVDAIGEYYTKVKEKADSVGIIINQTHGKMPGFRNIAHEDEALVKNTELDCFVTSVLGADTCVVHNATSIFLGANPDPELMHKLSFDMFSRIIPFAKKNGIKIATETFGDAVKYSACDFFGNIEEFEKAYKAIKDIDEFKDNFTICVDTGHSNKAMRYNNPAPEDVIRRLGSEVTVLHLNDNDTFTDQHKMPLSGTINWKKVFESLDEIGYNGVYNMELNLAHYGKELLVDTAEFAIKVMRNILNERYGN